MTLFWGCDLVKDSQGFSQGDYISRQYAIEELRDVIVKDVQFGDELTDGYNDGIDMAITVISKLPSAQPEIIRCKDCKHSRLFDQCFYCYELGGEIIVPENGFCFMAERRTDDLQ